MEDLKWVDQCIYEIELDINRRMFDILYTAIGAYVVAQRVYSLNATNTVPSSASDVTYHRKA